METMTTARFVTLYVDWETATVDVHIQRVTGTNRYALKKDEPSVARLWGVIKDCRHISYPAQQGWGVTDTNGRARQVFRV